MPVFALCDLKTQKVSAYGRRALPGSLANQLAFPQSSAAFPQSSVGAGWWRGLGCLHTPFVSDTALSLSTGVNNRERVERSRISAKKLQLACLRRLCFFFFLIRNSDEAFFTAPGSLSSVDKVQLSTFFLHQVSDDRMSQQGLCVEPPKATVAQESRWSLSSSLSFCFLICNTRIAGLRRSINKVIYHTVYRQGGLSTLPWPTPLF